jgi:hypothetical protein
LKNYFTGGPYVSGTFPFDHPGWLPSPACHPYFQWLGADGRRSSPPTWVGHSLSLLRTSSEGAIAHFTFPLPHSAACLTALLCTSSCFSCHCPSSMSRPELSDLAKRSFSSPRPPAPRACPLRQPAKPGDGISLPPSSSVSASPAAARSDCSPTLLTLQQALIRQGALLQPRLRPP